MVSISWSCFEKVLPNLLEEEENVGRMQVKHEDQVGHTLRYQLTRRAMDVFFDGKDGFPSVFVAQMTDVIHSLPLTLVPKG